MPISAAQNGNQSIRLWRLWPGWTMSPCRASRQHPSIDSAAGGTTQILHAVTFITSSLAVFHRVVTLGLDGAVPQQPQSHGLGEVLVRTLDIYELGQMVCQGVEFDALTVPAGIQGSNVPLVNVRAQVRNWRLHRDLMRDTESFSIQNAASSSVGTNDVRVTNAGHGRDTLTLGHHYDHLSLVHMGVVDLHRRAPRRPPRVGEDYIAVTDVPLVSGVMISSTESSSLPR